MVVMMLGYCLYGLCAFPNMVIDSNIARKSEKKGNKRGRLCKLLLTMLE